jgi:hypothetical protein
MVLIFLNLEKIVDGGTFDNFTTIIICYLDIFGGMLKNDLGYKVVYFGVDGVIVFQELKNNVSI